MALLPFVIVGLLATADAVLPVVPAEIVVVGAATRLAADPAGLATLIVAAALGSFAGQAAVFAAARRFQHSGRAGCGTWSRRVTSSPTIARWGPSALIVAGFFPAGRLAAAASVGMSGAPVGRFALAAAAGSLLGAAYLVGVGSFLQRTLGNSPWLVAGAALAVAALGSLVGRAIKPVRPAHP